MRFQSFLCLSLLASLVVTSCNKERALTPYMETSYKLIGQYDLTGITWVGSPVDITGDGEATNDIFTQMMSLPVNAGNEHSVRVIGDSSDFKDGSIGMEIPMQGYYVSLDGHSYKEDNMIGYCQPLYLGYRINPEGIVSVDHFDSFGLDKYDRRTELKKIHNGTMTFDLKGHVVFTAEHTLYDYRRQELIDGLIQYHFTCNDLQ